MGGAEEGMIQEDRFHNPFKKRCHDLSKNNKGIILDINRKGL
jgi:hypothetical protein